MLNRTPLCCPRSAVAFFNMKHFQVKHKVLLTPANVHATFTSCLRPRDRLLRQSTSGHGGSRVLVLDHMQQVKGVYLPLFCLPHPTSVAGGEGSLGVAVEDYLKVIAPLAEGAATTTNTTTTTTTTATMPTVLIVLSHPQGIAFGTYFADGRPAVPVENVEIDPIAPDREKDAPPTEALSSPRQIVRSSVGFLPSLTRLQSRLALHAAALAQCSTFYWFRRDATSSVGLKDLRLCQSAAAEEEMVTEGTATATSADGAAASDAAPPISFADPRWVELKDVAGETARANELYARDATTRLRIVKPEGLGAFVASGVLLLDHVPKSVQDVMAPKL